ncbi:conserved hypothetical protein [Trichormus variabilis ATCC 29413]|uniref:DUF2157 domain-containing protein n=2 Tax=Anabaena variabilis TaxID=264691 RepID=Q3M6W6_TRIV2|nr:MULTISPECIES: DUF2157 domain-containing protein [Nostocaceae]ABA23270.1 conserved hypothetical protein [Trichormus variabilis ATCC 29413]MBC1215588.1 DUF2157 domain-containing protein [Trichormus variabilis ARAD]MBC1255445.1 DUF2157 domain-containing protein [Trichormus variabilis V5]MBC1267336.1 DUF2157 domain-containing protein [Trichormus variabilis FSR]MBC1303941.1 DUF2157 domain-containing protein [Trichormus variabilis N2B]
MIFDNFQRKLRRDAELWRDEGIISASQYQQIADRYKFKNLEIAARDRFMMVAIAIGGVLLVVGVFTFAAANWFSWSREVKFILMMSLFFFVSITGFYTWREPTLKNKEGKKPQQSKRFLGEALLIFAAFILGANLILMAQIFNITGSTPELFIAWGFGVSFMAYSLSLNSLGIMAIILVQIGYWAGLGDLWYSSGEWGWARLAVRHMPLISWLLFVPLAYFCRSRWIFFLAAIFFASSLQFNLNPLPLLNFSDVAPWVASFALALPPAIFWSYDDLLFPTINYRLFQPLARNLALIAFGLVFYALSFRWQWQGLSYNSFGSTSNSNFSSVSVIDLGILSGLAVLQWLFLLRQRSNPPRREVVFNTTWIATFLGFIVVVPFWHQAINRIGDLGSFIFNVLLAVLSWGFIQEGLKLSDRRSFWGGMLLLTLLVISRMLEYDTDLLFRSMVFLMCGSILISTGMWFENRLTGSSNKKSS